MDQIVIRRHPYPPVAVEELDRWLEHEADDLRMDSPKGVVRLLRLEQSLPSGRVSSAWLLELDFAEGDLSLFRDGMAATLTDLRLLGLQPTLLTPHDPSTRPTEES